MITYYFKTVQDEKLQTITESRTGVWVHAVSPTHDELETLAATFHLDRAILEDAEDFFEVPRFERSDGGVYFFTRYPFDDENEAIDTAPVLIIVGESFVITIVQRNTPFLKPIFEGTKQVTTTQKTKLLIEFMSSITEAYEKELVRMRRAVHRDAVSLRQIRARDIERLVQYEHTLNDVVSALVPTNTWLQQVSKGNYLQLFAEDIELVDDLLIANSQLVDSAKSMLKTIQNIRSATEAILTQRLNTTVRTLTALTIVLTIPTIIASLYGMNVRLPLAEHPDAFWLVIVLVGMLISLAVYFFIRNQWL